MLTWHQPIRTPLTCLRSYSLVLELYDHCLWLYDLSNDFCSTTLMQCCQLHYNKSYVSQVNFFVTPGRKLERVWPLPFYCLLNNSVSWAINFFSPVTFFVGLCVTFLKLMFSDVGVQSFAYRDIYNGVSKCFRAESVTKYTLTTINKHSLRSNTKGCGGKTH